MREQAERAEREAEEERRREEEEAEARREQARQDAIDREERALALAEALLEEQRKSGCCSLQ
jgi:hypothetical protein